MNITYDPDANAAYVQLVTRIAPGEASELVDSIETPGERGKVILDFAPTGRLLGIEVQNTQDALPAEVIQNATTIR